MSKIPYHVAIVMDGNGRWANQRFLPRIAGHREGVGALRRIVNAAAEQGIAVLTVFAFSSENWNRPDDEVSGLMELLGMAIAREVPELTRDGVRLYFVGERACLSSKVQEALANAETATASNGGLVLNVCFNYGGRWDIAQAARRLASAGVELNEENLNQAMALAHVPDPDLLIRTGDEQRISNFLLWQAAYTELYFTPTLWPDFDASALSRAITDYGNRERRFGKTSAQVVRGLTHPSGSEPSHRAGSSSAVVGA
jgi:undecaprenyl diphosphate synthase